MCSHHLAHAHCAFETSGLRESAILVCDYAGSTTVDGNDFFSPFAAWYRMQTSQRRPLSTRTEAASIYSASRRSGYSLLEREYCVPHSSHDVFVYSAASLYENVSRYLFSAERAHGRTMALAAFGISEIGTDEDPGPLLAETGGTVSLRNDWQHQLPKAPEERTKRVLAFRCQEATERLLLHHARRAFVLSGSQDLAVGGGVFQNVLANRVLAEQSPFRSVFVPSAPHDGGIAVGCAFLGSKTLVGHGTVTAVRRQRSDRLGRRFDSEACGVAVERMSPFVTASKPNRRDLIGRLASGSIIARFDGRSEFGPRALGGRSLIASPTDPTVKDRLNEIKGREFWRPVAPIVPRDRFHEFFDGPTSSWMEFAQEVREDFRHKLPALSHPDYSTRAQSLREDDDPELYALLCEIESATGFPILVNTSLNRAGEPIVDTPDNAIELLLCRPQVDALLLEQVLVKRDTSWIDSETHRARIPSNSLLVRSSDDAGETTLVNGKHAVTIDTLLVEHLLDTPEDAATFRSLASTASELGQPALARLRTALVTGALETWCE